MPFLNRVCSALADKGIRYAIVGGHAVALHGAVRGTVDVDIALAWNLGSLKAAEQALNEIDLISRLPVTADDVFQFRDEYVQNRNLIGWNFYNPDNLAEQVDIVITYDLKGRKLERIDTASGQVRILGLRDLIEMKRASGRPQDLEDVNALEKLR
jgi:predicted nucleotidyltransferase